MVTKEKLSRAGYISKSHGFKGELQCVLEMARPEQILKEKFLFLIKEGLPVPYFIEAADVHGEQLIVKLEGIDSEETAKKNSKIEIYIERKKIAKKKVPVTWRDLTGYQAIDKQHGDLGPIEEIVEYPMHFVAKCTYKSIEILFPLIEEFVLEVDDEQKTVSLNLPEGLLDVYMG